jgi:hypothetical protein
MVVAKQTQLAMLIFNCTVIMLMPEHQRLHGEQHHNQ